MAIAALLIYLGGWAVTFGLRTWLQVRRTPPHGNPHRMGHTGRPSHGTAPDQRHSYPLGVTTPAVSQHLRALRAAGLLTSVRHGRSVLYRHSDLGDRLVAGAEAPQA